MNKLIDKFNNIKITDYQKINNRINEEICYDIINKLKDINLIGWNCYFK